MVSLHFMATPKRDIVPGPVELKGHPVAAFEQLFEEHGIKKYRARQGLVRERLERLGRLLGDEQRWWNRSPGYARALAAIDTFVENLEHNFAADSAFGRWLASGDAWPAWRERQLAAIRGLDTDRQDWRRAMQIIKGLDRE